MPHRPALLVTAAVLAAAVVALTSTGAAQATEAAHVAAGNATLVPQLLAAGGTVSPDGRWVDLPGGAAVSLRPAVFADCPVNYVCLWEDANYGGRIFKLTGAGAAYANLAAYPFANIMTSWANRSPWDARWFYSTSYGGTTRCMNAGTALANVGSTDNDQAESLRIYTDAVACS